jgi:hypothetical protein
MLIPTKQMSENRGTPELVKSWIGDNDSTRLISMLAGIPKDSPLNQPQRTVKTSSFPLVASAISAIDREIDVTKTRLARPVHKSSYSTGSTVCKRAKRKYKDKRMIIKQKLLSCRIPYDMHQCPMPAPPVLPRLQAGEKVTLVGRQ